MSWIDALRHRLRPLLRPDEWQREHDDEVRMHLELEAAQQRHDNDVLVAESQARLAFGPPTYYREETRRMTILRILDVLRQDARYGWRALLRSPAFTLTAVASLALGIGANTAIFGLVYAVLLEPLPLPRPDRLVGVQRMYEQSRFKAGGIGGFTAGELAELRRVPVARLTATTGTGGVRIEAAGQRDVLSIELVEGAFFVTLGVRPAAGRLITPDDDHEARPVVVISELLWERWFNRAPDAIGKTITLQGASFTVVGVTPRAYRGLSFPGTFTLAVPLGTATLLGLPDVRGQRGGLMQVVGRLADGTGLAAGSASIRALFDGCCSSGQLAHGATGKGPPGNSHAALVDISHGIAFGKIDLRGDYGRILLVLMAGVAVVLLIACANVGNLLLARATARTRELAVRLSLGASRGRVIRQLLTESTQLALLGGALGLALAAWGTNVLLHNMPGNLTVFTDIVAFRLKPALLGFTVGISMLCVLLFGLVPALRATQTDLVTPLKEGGGPRLGGRRGLLDRSIVVAQVALALLLVSCAGLLGATLRNLRQIDGGFATTQVLLVTVDTRGTSREREGVVPFHADLLERVRRMSGVRAAAMSMTTPVYGGRTSMGPIEVLGEKAPAGDDATVLVNPVTPGYFEASGIVLRSGRDFSVDDRTGTTRVAVISETLARRHFGGRDPLGRTVQLGDSVPLVIVGVTRDAKYRNLRGGAEPVLYMPVAQQATGADWPFVVITVRTAARPEALAAALGREIAAFGPDLRVQRLQVMEEAMDAALARERLAAGLAIVFGSLALGLAVVGLYGVVSYNVGRRTAEIGVRMALGARSRDVVWQVMRGSLAMVLTGVLLGAPLTFAAGKVLSAMLFGVGAHDPMLLLAAAFTLAGAAIAASAIPAARAARIDPLRALRQG